MLVHPHAVFTRFQTFFYTRGKSFFPDLLVDFAASHGGVPQVGRAAVGEANAAAGRNPAGWKIGAAQPAGEVVNATAVELRRQRGETFCAGVNANFRSSHAAL